MRTVMAVTPNAIRAYLHARGIRTSAPDSSPRVPLDGVCDLWRAAEAKLNDPLLGVRIARQVPFGAFCITEHLIVVSHDFSSAVARLVNSYRLVNEGCVLTMTASHGAMYMTVERADGDRIVSSYAQFILESVRLRLNIALGVSHDMPPPRHITNTSAPASLPCLHARFSAVF